MLLVLALTLLASPADLESAEREAVQLPPEAGLALVRRWAEEHPQDPQLPKAWLWQAQRLIALARFDEARALLTKAAEDGQGDTTWDARLALADVFYAQGRLSDAVTAYDDLHAPPGSRWEYQAQYRAADARDERRRGRLMWAALGSLSLVLAALTFSARKALLPPPAELVWSAPVLALFAIAGLTRPPGERFTVVAIALGGLLLAWVDGAWLSRRRLNVASRVAAALVALLQVGALVFCAVVAGGLWQRVLDTFAGGTD